MELGRRSDYVKHPYQRDGSFTADLTVTWQGEFRAGGGSWEELPEMTVDRGEAGDLTIPGPAERPERQLIESLPALAAPRPQAPEVPPFLGFGALRTRGCRFPRCAR